MASDSNCIFCKIAAKQIPAFIVHESDDLLAFLDVSPLSQGHLLVIPRHHYEQVIDVPGDILGRLAALLPGLGRALISASGAPGFNILQNNGSVAGQVVPHVHFHLIPRREGDGLGYRWNAGSYPAGRDAELAEAYRSALADAT